MKKQISYNEPVPQFDPITHNRLPDKIERYSVIANNADEYAAHIEAINNPERGITDIAEVDLPDDESLSFEDYLPTALFNAIMEGVNSVE